jgi:hypothetical protein
LHAAGRFLSKDVAGDDDELLGFALDPSLPVDLAGLDGSCLALPRGSRLAIAHWPGAPVEAGFVQLQCAAGVEVEVVALEGVDEPAWDDPAQFELQLFPRRAVNRLAAHLAEAA